MNGWSQTTRGTSDVRSNASLQWQKTPVQESSQGSLSSNHDARRREVPSASKAALISSRAALSPSKVAAWMKSVSVQNEKASNRSRNISGRFVLL